jgi:hypothetical protein
VVSVVVVMLRKFESLITTARSRRGQVSASRGVRYRDVCYAILFPLGYPKLTPRN